MILRATVDSQGSSVYRLCYELKDRGSIAGCSFFDTASRLALRPTQWVLQALTLEIRRQ